MKNILIDAERTNYNHTGLYYFCKHLVNALVLHNESGELYLNTYAPEKTRDLFHKSIPLVHQHSLHKFHLPFLSKFHLFHSTFQGSNYFPFRLKGKIISTIHDLNFLYEEKKAAYKKQCIRNLERKLKRSDTVVAISEFVKNELLQHTNVDPQKIQVIYNGCNISPFQVPEIPSYVPQRPFFFTIGAITKKKNFHVLPAMLLKNDFELIIAGIPQCREYKSRIEKTAIELGVRERVHFVGIVSDEQKIWYLRNCIAFAFPSIAEGFGLPVIEAMYFGKPAILSSLTSLPEIGGPAAYFLDNFDPGYISEKTIEILQEYYTHRPQDAICEWAKHFNWNKTARQYLNEYQKLLF